MKQQLRAPAGFSLSEDPYLWSQPEKIHAYAIQHAWATTHGILIQHTLQPLKGDFSKLASGLPENSQEATVSQGKKKLTTKDIPTQPEEANCCCSAPQVTSKVKQLRLEHLTWQTESSDWWEPLTCQCVDLTDWEWDRRLPPPRCWQHLPQSPSQRKLCPSCSPAPCRAVASTANYFADVRGCGGWEFVVAVLGGHRQGPTLALCSSPGLSHVTPSFFPHHAPVQTRNSSALLWPLPWGDLQQAADGSCC